MVLIPDRHAGCPMAAMVTVHELIEKKKQIEIISPKIISLMYSQNAPDFFNKIIEGRDKFSLDYYIKLGRKRLLQIIKRSFLIFTFFIATINILGLSILFPVGLGFLVTTLFFLLQWF